MVTVSEGIRRLSLLLGLIGLGCGLFLGWLAWDTVRRPVRARVRYEEQTKAYEQQRRAWEQKIYEIELDGIKYRFVGSEAVNDFAQALRRDEGRWYKERAGGWEEITDPDFRPLGEGIVRLMFLPDAAPSPPDEPTEPLPTPLDYSKLLAFPLLGFLLPWGTVRVVGWVVMGFVLDWRDRGQRARKDG